MTPEWNDTDLERAEKQLQVEFPEKQKSVIQAFVREGARVLPSRLGCAALVVMVRDIVKNGALRGDVVERLILLAPPQRA